MAKYLFRALMKAGQVFENPFGMGNPYNIPSRRGARDDFKRVLGDMRKIGNQLRKVTERELSNNGR